LVILSKILSFFNCFFAPAVTILLLWPAHEGELPEIDGDIKSSAAERQLFREIFFD
jgi:hypothetical protein